MGEQSSEFIDREEAVEALGTDGLHLVHDKDDAVEERHVSRTTLTTTPQLIDRRGVGHRVEGRVCVYKTTNNNHDSVSNVSVSRLQTP